jgi:hypothetical protein
VKSADTRACVIVDDRRALPTAFELLAQRRAYAVVLLDDGPDGRVDVRYWIASDAEHRVAELEALIAQSAEKSGGLAVDAARLVARGKA